MLDTTTRLAGATVVAFLGMTVVKSPRRTILSWVLRFVVALPLFALAVWLVLASVPFRTSTATQTFSLVATAVLIAGLGAEELIGADLRRILGI